MKYLLTLFALFFLSESGIGNETDEAEAVLRLIAARREQPKPKEVEVTPPIPTGYHSETGSDGAHYWVKDGYTLQKSSGVISHPFPSGAGTQDTPAPSVVETSSLSIATIGTGRTIIGAPMMGRFGVTNCPPSG